MSAFVLEDGVVYHTYSTYARGLDGLWGMYQWLDRAPKGRNETGPSGCAATTNTASIERDRCGCFGQLGSLGARHSSDASWDAATTRKTRPSEVAGPALSEVEGSRSLMIFNGQAIPLGLSPSALRAPPRWGRLGGEGNASAVSESRSFE